jgi:hypothetical protein
LSEPHFPYHLFTNAGSAYEGSDRRGPPIQNQALTLRIGPHGSTLV